MEVLENEFVKFWFRDSILMSEYTKPTDLTIENAKDLIRLRHEISCNKKQYWCYDFKNVVSYSKEVRDYADKHGQEYLYACGAVVHSHITKFILNTFMKLKNPKIPLKAFTSKEDAVSWLKQLKAENEAKGIC